MVIDLEQIVFPPTLDPWEHHANMGGVGSLMTNFNDIRAPESEFARVGKILLWLCQMIYRNS